MTDAGDKALLFHPDFVGGACFDARLTCCPQVRGAAVDVGLTCTGTHSADYAPQNWRIEIVELLRVVQLYNMGGYHVCLEGEDGFCPNP